MTYIKWFNILINYNIIKKDPYGSKGQVQDLVGD